MASILLPDGPYLIEIKDAKFIEPVKGRPRESPLIKIGGTVLTGAYTGNYISTQLGVYLDNYTAMTVFDRWMEALGANKEDWEPELRTTGALTETLNQLVGNQVVFVMGHDEYPRGKEPKSYRNYVNRIEPVSVERHAK